ncbi:MAG: 50S ribosomal protein L21e [Candidatus ainarchaeum sp.]|nr:50S ribosomal protein L21e [Candidatus ainarchaeum sp.]
MAKITGSPRVGGKRSKTRSKFKKRGSKITVNQEVREFEIGDNVQIVIDSSYHKGFPYKGFHGLSGKVTAKRGSSFEIKLKRGNKDFIVVTTPVHVKKLGVKENKQVKNSKKKAKEIKEAKKSKKE